MDKEKLKKLGIVPIDYGEAHLQDEITSRVCKICGKEESEDMVLLKSGEKKLSFACLSHQGVVQEFLRTYQRLPIGYKQYRY